MNDHIDKHELQRLLDGNLPADERELFLELADEQPQSWRVIALAFVEEQVLREEFAKLNSEESPIVPPTGSEQQIQSARAEVKAKSAEKPQKSWSSILLQAAIVLLLVGAGTLVGRYSVRSNGDVGGYIMVVAPTQPQTNSAVQTIGLEPAAYQAGTYQTPADLMPTPLFDQESRNVIHDHGYTVTEEPVLYMIQNQAGEQYVIPHRKVSLVAHNE
jgi:hypothetical protein